MNTYRQNTSLRGLRTFCVAARHENFRAAADDLYVTASAISHQIKTLEQELGFELFDRGGRSLSLTPHGHSLFEALRPLIEQVDDVVRDHRVRGGRQSLRISVQPFFASELFVPRLPEFTAKNPDIDIQVETSDESTERIPAGADVSIRLFSQPPENATAELLFPLRLVPAGSADFVERMIVRNNKIESEFPIIVHDTRPKAWSRWAKKHDIALPRNSKVIRLDSMIAVARAAERGLGAALIPVPLGNVWFDSGTLKKLFRNELIVDGGYYLITTPESQRKETVGLLRQWVLETFVEASAPEAA
ncbi:MAG: LysR substrate-binding domain-containing protein [Pseudomonadota bacterium]